MRRLGPCILAASITLAACGSDPDGIVFDGLSQPRGISVDGSRVCVAEAGAIGPEGPAREQPGQLEADTGRVLCRERDGSEQQTVLDELPFVYYPDAAVTSGVADVVVDGTDLYVLVGESFGDLARSVVKVHSDGADKLVDLLDFAESRSIAGDGLKSNPYSFVLSRDRTEFFIADAATGTLLRAGEDGDVELFSPVPGHEVLTGVTWGPDGDLYVGSFGQLPHPPGSGEVVAVDMEGQHRTVVDGLTMPIDLGFDNRGGLLILEYSSPPDDPGGTDAYRDQAGRLLYRSQPALDGALIVLLDGLERPTGLFVEDDAVWISLSESEQAPQEGRVERYLLSDLLDD